MSERHLFLANAVAATSGSPAAMWAENEAFGLPVRLASWLAANGDLLDALVTLRRLGPEGADALDAALDIRRVAVMRFSLSLWDALIAHEGEDPDALLHAELAPHVVDRLRGAIGVTDREVECGLGRDMRGLGKRPARVRSADEAG
jgi:hypothetical protein